MTESQPLQREIRNWWEQNPMTYDWNKTVPHQEGTSEFYREIDRRFWKAAWFAHETGAQPFSRIIPYRELRDKRVLEIGCGAGALTAELAKAGARLTAIDLSSHATQLTRRRLELFGLQADVCTMDAESLEFPSNTFDYIWSWGVIHHSSNPQRILDEIHRVLTAEGRCTFMVYHRNSIRYWAGFMLVRGVLMGQLFRYSPRELANHYSDGFIANHYSRKEVRRMCRRFSRVDVRIFGQKEELYPIPAGRVKSALVAATSDRFARPLLSSWGWFLTTYAVK